MDGLLSSTPLVSTVGKNPYRNPHGHPLGYYSNLVTHYGLPYQAAEPTVLASTIPTCVHSPCPPCPYLNVGVVAALTDRPEKAFTLKTALLGIYGQIASWVAEIVPDVLADCKECFLKR